MSSSTVPSRSSSESAPVGRRPSNPNRRKRWPGRPSMAVMDVSCVWVRGLFWSTRGVSHLHELFSLFLRSPSGQRGWRKVLVPFDHLSDDVVPVPQVQGPARRVGHQFGPVLLLALALYSSCRCLLVRLTTVGRDHLEPAVVLGHVSEEGLKKGVDERKVGGWVVSLVFVAGLCQAELGRSRSRDLELLVNLLQDVLVHECRWFPLTGQLLGRPIVEPEGADPTLHAHIPWRAPRRCPRRPRPGPGGA